MPIIELRYSISALGIRTLPVCLGTFRFLLPTPYLGGMSQSVPVPVGGDQEKKRIGKPNLNWIPNPKSG